MQDGQHADGSRSALNQVASWEGIKSKDRQEKELQRKAFKGVRRREKERESSQK